MNVYKTFRRCPERLLNALCTFNLCPVSRGINVVLENSRVSNIVSYSYSKCFTKIFNSIDNKILIVVIHECAFETLHKKWSFPLRISPVNVTKSAVSLCISIIKTSLWGSEDGQCPRCSNRLGNTSIMTDLIKTYNCIPSDLIVVKLEAQRYDKLSMAFLKNYLGGKNEL